LEFITVKKYGLNSDAQIKLLQVLQDGTYQRVGSEETLKTDVRVIAATNADLKKMCNDGKFRNDLYYRLSQQLPLGQKNERRNLADLNFKQFIYKTGTSDSGISENRT